MAEKNDFNKVHRLPTRSVHSDRGNDSGGGGGHTGGGSEPPEGTSLEKRVEKLEGTATDIQLRMVRIETRLESIEGNMATHSDISGLKADLYKAINDQTWKFIAVAGVLAGLAFTAARFIPGGPTG